MDGKCLMDINSFSFSPIALYIIYSISAALVSIADLRFSPKLLLARRREGDLSKSSDKRDVKRHVCFSAICGTLTGDGEMESA